MNGTMLGILAFVLVAGATAVWFSKAQRVEIPEDRRGFVATWSLGAALGILSLTQPAGTFASILAGVAVLGGLFLSALVFVSPQRVAADAIRVGDRLREFTAIDDRGDDFTISDVAGKPLLLKFFRGHW